MFWCSEVINRIVGWFLAMEAEEEAVLWIVECANDASYGKITSLCCVCLGVSPQAISPVLAFDNRRLPECYYFDKIFRNVCFAGSKRALLAPCAHIEREAYIPHVNVNDNEHRCCRRPPSSTGIICALSCGLCTLLIHALCCSDGFTI